MQSGCSKTLRPSHSWVVAIAVATLMVELVVIGGCAGPSLYPRVIQEDQDRYVKLEARYGRGQEGEAMRFSHPIALNETEWALILDGIHIQPRQWFITIGTQKADAPPAFEESDRRYLARHVANAFLKARPDEWVVFYLSHPREAEVVEITSGGFFVEGERVHLVLANYRQPVSMSFIRQTIWDDPLRPSGQTYYEIVPGEHQTLQTYWRWYPTKPLLAYPSELVIEYRAMLNSSGGIAATSETPGGAGYELENKLRVLERLHEQGLITEEEYQLKRAKLLDEL